MSEEIDKGGIEAVPESRETELLPNPGFEQEKPVEQTPENIAERLEDRYSEILSKASPAVAAAASVPEAQVETDAKAVYDETDANARVTKLVALAETKGIEYAVKVARKLNDFYVLDQMHDELSGRFYDALKQKGLIGDGE